MRTFIDGDNRTWTVKITIGTAIRVRELTGVDILQPETDSGSVAVRLAVDSVFVAQVVTAILRPDIERAGITPEQFADSLDGKAAAAAQTAVTEELRDFFADSGRADRALMIQTTMAKLAESAERITSGAASGVLPEASA